MEQSTCLRATYLTLPEVTDVADTDDDDGVVSLGGGAEISWNHHRSPAPSAKEDSFPRSPSFIYPENHFSLSDCKRASSNAHLIKASEQILPTPWERPEMILAKQRPDPGDDMK